MKNFGFSSHFVKDLRGRNHLLGKDGVYVQSAAMAIRYGMGREDAHKLCAALNAGRIAGETGRRYRVVRLDTGKLPRGIELYDAIDMAIVAAEGVSAEQKRAALAAVVPAEAQA